MFPYFHYLQRIIYTIYFDEAGLTKKFRMFFKAILLLIVRYTLSITHLQIFMNCLIFLNQKLMLGETIRYKGVTYYINDYLSLLILSPFYERQVFLCLFKEIKRLLHLKDQIVMVDLGAHIGKYTVYFAKLFKSLRIIAVEPAPTNFIMLRKAIEANHLENVTPLRIACTDIDGETQLYISFKSDVHSLVKRSGAVTSIMVKGQSLDNLVGELRLESVDIIKIDVEGAEYKVLKGGLNTIRKHKPVILIEIWPSNHKTVVEFLRKLDYDVTSIEGANYIAKPTSR